MSLKVEKLFLICHSIYQYAKANRKNYEKNKESSHLQYQHVNNLYGWEMLQKE